MSAFPPGRWRSAAWLVASGLGLGRLRPAPGTWASLAATLAALPLLGHPVALACAAMSAFGLGLWAVPRAGGADDPGWVVVDELAGQWLALSGLGWWPANAVLASRPAAVAWGWAWACAGFALFRLLDILKPGPIGAIDRRGGAFGVMADDLLAGLVAAVALAVARHLLG